MERISGNSRGGVVGAALVIVLSAAGSTPAHPQEMDFVRTLFKDVHSITLFASFAEIRKSPQLGTQSSQCLFLGVCGGGAEVLWDLTPSEQNLHLELGLGASYLRGFSGKPLPDLFDLRASVRSFPEFGAYLSGTLADLELLSPYIGGNFGFADLWNAQVHAADRRQTSLKGQTFDYGVVLGLAVNASWGGNAFIEGAYRGRRFPSLDYNTSEPLPATWPRELDFSGWEIAVGWQFELKSKAGQAGVKK